MSIGYPLTYNPWKLSIFKGTMEKVTGWTIQWVEFEDPEKAISALANGESQMVVADSANFAKACSRGVDAKMLWVIEQMDEGEGLVVHNRYAFNADYGGAIRSPRDLRGKRVGVYFGSTAHYLLIRFLEQMNLDYDETVDYQYGQHCLYTPCHYASDSDKVTVVSLTKGRQFVDESPGTLWYAWERNEIHAAWVGFPHMHYFKQNGTVMADNNAMSKWGYKTFQGLIMDWAWYVNPGDARYTDAKMQQFIKQILQEMAKANFYYFNNTKEFEASHPVYKGVNRQQVQRVDGRIAGVIGGIYKLTWPHIKAIKLVPVSEQVKCEWLGCGEGSAVAWALKNTAEFLQAVKFTWDTPDRGGEKVLLDYSNFLFTYFLDLMAASGNAEAFYDILEGESVELGYHTDYVE